MRVAGAGGGRFAAAARRGRQQNQKAAGSTQGTQQHASAPRPAPRTTSAESSASDLESPFCAQTGSGTVTYSHAGHILLTRGGRHGSGALTDPAETLCWTSKPRPPLGPRAPVRELPDGHTAPRLLHAQPEKRHGPSCRRLPPRSCPVCCPRPGCREDPGSHAGVTDTGPHCHCTCSAGPASGLGERAAGAPGVSVQPEGSCASQGRASSQGELRLWPPEQGLQHPHSETEPGKTARPAHLMRPGRPADQACGAPSALRRRSSPTRRSSPVVL